MWQSLVSLLIGFILITNAGSSTASGNAEEVISSTRPIRHNSQNQFEQRDMQRTAGPYGKSQVISDKESSSGESSSHYENNHNQLQELEKEIKEEMLKFGDQNKGSYHVK